MKTATFKQNPLSTSSDYTTENCQTRSERIRTRVALRKDTMKKIAKRAIRYRIPMEVTHVMDPSICHEVMGPDSMILVF